MSDSFVTQCPHCRTSFRVSQAQLSAAQGAVRCGACLHVFNAQQHLQEKPLAAIPPAVHVAKLKESTPKQPATDVTVERKDSLDTVRIHDDLDLDSLDLDEELARLEQEEQFRSNNLAQPHKPQDAQPPLVIAPAAKSKADEDWAERLIAESQGPAASKPVLSPAEKTTKSTKQTAVSITSDSTQENRDDSFERREPAFGTGSEKDSETADDYEETDAEIEEIELALPAPDRDKPARFSNSDNLLELNQDPLLLEWQPPSKPWGRWLGWALLNLLAAGALVGQYTLYHFDELARQDQYRPWFESICPQLGCALPPKVNVDLLKSSNLVIRSHPDFSGALVVDAILYNRANFAQPFPLLELRFSDINNKPLANRRFKPSEYLAGELAGESEMPPQTPIHISLDILDPGQEAVNYTLIFQSPE